MLWSSLRFSTTVSESTMALMMATGGRAADFLLGLKGRVFELDTSGLEMLVYACRHHSDGLVEGDVTVRTSWDADRLDLGRVGIKPCASRLATNEGRRPELIEWAFKRSIA